MIVLKPFVMSIQEEVSFEVVVLSIEVVALGMEAEQLTDDVRALKVAKGEEGKRGSIMQ